MIKSKGRISSSIPAFAEQQSSEMLEPIYSKVNLLKKELEMIKGQQRQAQTIFFTKTWKQQFLQMNIDRDLEIEKSRKLHDSREISKKEQFTKIKKSVSTTTSANWQYHKRDSTKSLINFLANNKSVKRAQSQTGLKSRLTKRESDKEQVKKEEFKPLGEEYKKELHYQQSLKSETHSLSASRHDSMSLRSSTVQGVRRQNSKKYLRKGTRVRQMLMRQLQTPQQRGSSAQTLTYLKDYDQWVPTALVEEKKAELQSFMNIIYGDKKAAKVEAVDLDNIKLIYL